MRYVEDAIRACFIDMDKLYEGKDAGLSNDATYNAEVFLAHFDAIFTTNHDGLIERLFANLFNSLGYKRTDKPNRFGVALPGVVGTPTLYMQPDYRRESAYLVPDEPFSFTSVDGRYLPYIKLHGSMIGKRLWATA